VGACSNKQPPILDTMESPQLEDLVPVDIWRLEVGD
jgi:hypothetical protein